MIGESRIVDVRVWIEAYCDWQPVGAPPEVPDEDAANDRTHVELPAVWRTREWPTAPLGYEFLLEATDRAGRAMYGKNWHDPPEAGAEFEDVILRIAKACEAGRTPTACRARDGKTEHGLGPIESGPDWHADNWPDYFRWGVEFGPGSARWIFVRQQQFNELLAGLPPAESPAPIAEAGPEESPPPTTPPARPAIADPAPDASEPVAAGNTGGRKPIVTLDKVAAEVSRLMEEKGEFCADDPEWDVQARLEEKIGYFCEKLTGKRPSETTLKGYIKGPLQQWRGRSET
jgi:hypothetical protein